MGWLLGIKGVSNGSLCMCASVRALVPAARAYGLRSLCAQALATGQTGSVSPAGRKGVYACLHTLSNRPSSCSAEREAE